jgi:hypothetical protein
MDGAQRSADEHSDGRSARCPAVLRSGPAAVVRPVTGADYRVVSDRDLEREGGIVAVVEAVASLHAQALRACRWLPVADEVVGPPHAG